MLSSKLRRWLAAGVVMMFLMSLMAVLGTSAQEADAHDKSFDFDMVASNGNIKNCLPNARGHVRVEPGKENDKLTIEVYGLAPKTGYDLFVTQIPGPKFGLAWYQSDLETNAEGYGKVSVRGIFDRETFTISQASLTTQGREDQPQTGATFGAVNMYHLGLWFNDPQVPFNLGCEPGQNAPVVTPFNGEQHAGIQVLNTSNFADNAGPLKKVSR